MIFELEPDMKFCTMMNRVLVLPDGCSSLFLVEVHQYG